MEKAVGTPTEDPMAFLNAMREKTAQLLEQLDPEAPMSPRAAAKENMRMQASASSSTVTYDLTLSAPPSTLTPDQEVEWWKRKIAALSAPVVDDAPKAAPKLDSLSEFKPALGAKRTDIAGAKGGEDEKSSQKSEK